MNLTEAHIKDIAEDLDCGMICYINRKTGEVKTILDSENLYEDDENPWAEDLREVEENYPDYLEIVGMDSRESFRVMADFVQRVDDVQLHEKLINALNYRKPFQNFKFIIDDAGEYRQEWFKYKEKRLMAWVKQQIEVNIEKNLE